MLAVCGVVLGLVASPVPASAGDASPDDPVFEQGLQWGLERIGAPGAWRRGTGDGVTIAVVDTGIDLEHEDLASKVVAQVSCVGTDGDDARCKGRAQDDNGHGSHVINLSLGGGTLQGALGCSFCDAVEYAWGKGAIPVIAAGNDSVLPAGFADEHAVIVTATTRGDARASYSNASSGLLRNARWPISAPGGEGETAASDCGTGGTPKGVLSAYWVSGHRNEYACLAGTSMAAPHVAGSLAVLLSLGRSPQAAIDRLLATAQDLGPAGRDDQFGVGRLDLGRAVGTAPGNSTASTSAAGTTVTTDPAVTSTTPGEAPPTTALGATTTSPPVSIPEPVQAAPFTPAAPPADTSGDPPSWLVALAVAALLASGAGTAGVAWRLAEREQH